ncbi:MAG: beta-propeller domain-containing protein [Beutenbergiaceae bacterium]
MRHQRIALLGVALTLTLAACSSQSSPPPGTAAGNLAALASFDSCPALLEHLQTEAAERVTAWGLGLEPWITEDRSQDQALDSASPSSTEVGSGSTTGTFSGTNNQEAGVDEADIVKSNGTIIVTAADGLIQVTDVRSGSVLSTLETDAVIDYTGNVVDHTELLLRGDDLVELTSSPWWGSDARTFVRTIDLSDPTDPQVVGAISLEGSYDSARLIDGTVRLVMQTSPPGLVFEQPQASSAEQEALEANRRVIAESTIDDWLPHWQNIDSDGRGDSPQLLLDCDQIGKPSEFSGFTTVSVLSLDIDGDARPTSAAGVLAATGSVYASADRVLVATQAVPAGDVNAPAGDVVSSTSLHSFDISAADRTEYVASGQVDGVLLNQFSMDEHQGVIRVTTTMASESGQWSDTSSSLFVLAERGGELVETGRVDGLGLTEQIYAVRYPTPELAVVVTFRQTDPLYLIDTSDPSAPVTTGELKIPGYSAYLHPVGEGSLLGIGQDADLDGTTLGVQASLFDIADVTDPQQVSQLSWVGTSSTIEWEHRAFLQWQDRVYLPIQTWSQDLVGTVQDNADSDVAEPGEPIDSDEYWPEWGIVTVDLADGTLTEGPRIDIAVPGTEWTGGVLRTFVAGDWLWAMTEDSLHRFDLQTLEGGPITDI